MLRGNANNALRRIAFACDSLIVMRTPVDTGNARVNWRVAVNSIDTAYLPGLVRSTSRDMSAITNFSIGDYIAISNSTPYIVYLENGSSRQAPNGMVAVTLVDMANKINRGMFNGS